MLFYELGKKKTKKKQILTHEKIHDAQCYIDNN